MGIVEDFLTNNLPVPPAQDDPPKAVGPDEKQPLKMNANKYEDKIDVRKKTPQIRVTEKERIGKSQNFRDFAEESPYAKVAEQLRLNKPKPPKDTDRLRKMAGIQAISEALRNVVDGVYGAKKAVIVPHKTFTNEFIKEADKIDADYASKLAKWQKSLSDNAKNAFESYLRQITRDDIVNLKETITTSGGDETRTTKSTGKQPYAPNWNIRRASKPGSTKEPTKILFGQTGQTRLLTEEVARAAFNIIAQFKTYSPEYEQFVSQVKQGGIAATTKELGALIQHAVDAFPEHASKIADLWKIPVIQPQQSTNIHQQAGKHSSNTSSETPQKPKNKTVTQPASSGKKGIEAYDQYRID